MLAFLAPYSYAWASPPPPTVALGRRAVLAGALASRLLAESPAAALAESPPTFPIIAAQSSLRWLANADDVTTFKTMLKIGLPATGTLQMPDVIQFNLFKTIEPTLPDRDAGPFMDAAIEYVEYTRDANDLVSLATGAKRQGAPADIVNDYVERAVEAAQGAKRAADRMVPLLPGV